MKVYETTFILSPQADDAAFDRQINAISNLISKHNGKLIHEDRWGIRRLAFPIHKFTQGFYTRLLFEGNRELLTEMDRHFKIEEPYLRHLTVVFEGDIEKVKGSRRQEEPGDSDRERPGRPEPPSRGRDERKPRYAAADASSADDDNDSDDDQE